MADKQAQLATIMREATAVFRKGNLPLAVRLFSQAIIMDGGKSEIIFNGRALAYIRMNKFTEALVDAEKVIEIKKSWVKGYLRKGQALNGLGQYAEAFMVLMEGLDKDPKDRLLRATMLESKKQMTGGKGDGPIASPFADFKLWKKIEKNPLTRQYLNQPDFRDIVTKIQKDPNELKNYMDDARIMTTLGMLLDVDIEAPAEAAGDMATGAIHEMLPTATPSPAGSGGLSSNLFKQFFPNWMGPSLSDDVDEVTPKRGPTITELPDDDDDNDGTAAEGPTSRGKKSEEVMPPKRDPTITELPHDDGIAAEGPTSRGKRSKKNKSARKAAAAAAAAAAATSAAVAVANDETEDGVTEAKSENGRTRNESVKRATLENVVPPEKKVAEEPRHVAEPMATGELKALEAKERGNAAYKQKQFGTAIEHYTTAIELDPVNITFRTNRGAVYFEQGNYDECIKECEAAVDIGRENRADFKLIAKAFSRTANAYLKKGDLENALKYFEKSVSEDRTTGLVKKVIELKKQIKEKERLAYVDVDKSLEAKKLGNTAFTKGDYPAAIKFYNDAINRNPEDAKLFSNRAACYTKLAEFGMAVKDANECIRLDPNFVKGYLRKGGCLLAMKDYSKAKVAYQKAMELDQNCQEALDGFRRCSAEENDPEAVQQRVMNDPEIRKILQDPGMQTILSQMQQDTSAVREHLKNPVIAEKIQKLIDSGLIRMQAM